MALKLRSRSKTSVTSLIRSTNTNVRSLRNVSWSACSTLRKKTDALVTLVETSHSTYSSGRRGRFGRNRSDTGTPPVSSDARIVRRTSTTSVRRRPRCSCPCVASRRFSCATTRCTAARSWSGPDGSARSNSRRGRDGGNDCVRSISARSSSRRRCRSKARSRSCGTASGSGSVCPADSAFSSKARRIRCTSTPITPEPSPWRPNAAIARRARSLISPSDPARTASRIRSRRASKSSRSPPSKRCSVSPFSTASRSTARKKKRSNTSSNTRRSSCDFASVAASASRKSSCFVHGTCRSAANASSSSLVPTCSPSWRSASASSSSRAGTPGAPGSGRPPYRALPPARGRTGGGVLPDPPEDSTGAAQLDPDALCHHIEVGAVLHDDRERALEHGLVDVVGAEQDQRARPVDRFCDRGRLLQVEPAHHVDHLDELARSLLAELRRVQAHDLELALHVRVVEPEIQAAALQGLGQLTRVVRREQDERVRLRLDHAQLRDRDLEVRQHLEQHRLELLVGLVDLVDQQHDRLGLGDRLQQRAGEKELLAEDVVLHRLPAGVGSLGLDAQELLAVVPLVQRLGLVEPLVALEADQLAAGGAGERLGQLRLADAGGASHQPRLAELAREERHERRRLARQIARAGEAFGHRLDALDRFRHRLKDTSATLLALVTVFADSFLGKDFKFEPRPGPFIALAVIGFVLSVIGHLTASKTIIVTGIAMVFGGVLFVPLALYLSGRG